MKIRYAESEILDLRDYLKMAAQFTLMVNEQRSAEDQGFMASIVELSIDPIDQQIFN